MARKYELRKWRVMVLGTIDKETMRFPKTTREDKDDKLNQIDLSERRNLAEPM